MRAASGVTPRDASSPASEGPGAAAAMPEGGPMPGVYGGHRMPDINMKIRGGTTSTSVLAGG